MTIAIRAEIPSTETDENIFEIMFTALFSARPVDPSVNIRQAFRDDSNEAPPA